MIHFLLDFSFFFFFSLIHLGPLRWIRCRRLLFFFLCFICGCLSDSVTLLLCGRIIVVRWLGSDCFADLDLFVLVAFPSQPSFLYTHIYLLLFFLRSLMDILLFLFRSLM